MHPEQVKSIKIIFSDLVDEVVVKVNGTPFREGTQKKFKTLTDKLKPNNKTPPPIDEQTAIWAFFDAVTSFSLKRNLFTPLLDDGNDSNLLIVFYVQIMPDDFVMQLHRF